MTKIDLALKYLGFVLQDPTFGTNLRDEFERELSAMSGRPKKERPSPISFDSVGLKWNNIPGTLLSLWKTACPAVNVEAELAAAAAWMIANPVRAPKSNYSRFLDGWMKRTQQRGGTRGFTQSQRPDEADEWAKS